jgi:hypothetical protein
MSEENLMQVHFPDLDAQLDGLKIRLDKPVDRPMRLTGKCREAFQEWYRNPLGTDEPRWTNWKGIDLYSLTIFDKLDSSMQFGVLVDFFYSVGILVEFSLYETTVTIIDYDHSIEEQAYEFDVTYEFESSTSYILDYMTFAINKANEIFNER